jgi:membrane complex biogenesis BtpA family protein
LLSKERKDMDFKKKRIIAVIHLLPLPGSPLFDGDMNNVIRVATEEAVIYQQEGIDALIIENFRDAPFFKDQVPPETIAAMTVVVQKIKEVFSGDIGVNVLRNDAKAALGIATATGAAFIRVNVHIGAMLTDQGIIEGRAAETLRLKAALKSNVKIFSDVAVKHAAPLGERPIEDETKDVTLRGMADAVIVSGSRTGEGVDMEQLQRVKSASHRPVLIGSGITLDNISGYLSLADGFIVGSYFKTGGKADHFVDRQRVHDFVQYFIRNID